RRYLELRQRDLLVAHDSQWVSPLARVLQCKSGQWGGGVFRRGFVEYFNLPAAVVNKHGHKLAELTPVGGLFLPPFPAGELIALCEQPWLRSLTALHLPEVAITALVAERLVACRYLGDLRRLVIEVSTIPEVWRERFSHRFLGIMEAPAEHWTGFGARP